MNAALVIHPSDTVAVALRDIQAGEKIAAGNADITLAQPVRAGHKIAITQISQGADVIKYASPIGHATVPIAPGEWVHSHNLATNLGEILDYRYEPAEVRLATGNTDSTFSGYRRENGTAGIRNEIWIIPTVGCVNRIAESLAREASAEANDTDGVFAFAHPYGCSQLGDDHTTTQKILAGLVRHPNAGGVLVIGLGCENNNIAEFNKVLGPQDTQRVKFLNCQDVGDEHEAGMELLRELIGYAGQFRREPVLVSTLKIGVKCGGSDAFSGITANPLVGVISDMLVSSGGTTLLSEVPEMFGAEHLLMNRCAGRETFDATVKMVNDFKQYFMRHDQPIYENPSPGNKEGGITTLEEKSLGCTQKAGTSAVVDVLAYGDAATLPGLNLLSGPGNDIVSTTALAAAGAQIVLFTTGRGTPLGGPVPTVKLATNSGLAKRKPGWIDFNAGVLLEGKTMEQTAEELFKDLLSVASGEKTGNEKHGFREIAIFKDGVTL